MFEFLKPKKKEKSKEELFAEELYNPNGPNDDTLSKLLVGGIDFQKIYEKAQEIKPGWLDKKESALGILDAVISDGCYKTTKKLFDSGIPLSSAGFLNAENLDVLELCWQHGGKKLALEEREARFLSSEQDEKTDFLHAEVDNAFEDTMSASNGEEQDFSKLRWMLAKCEEVDGGKIDWEKIDTYNIWENVALPSKNTSVKKDTPKIVQEMLNDGLNKDEVFFGENYVSTPLSMMIRDNNVDMAELLLKKHADVYQYIRIGEKNYPTILDYVREKGSPEMIQMFKDNLKNQKTALARLEPKKEDKPNENRIPGIKTPEEMAESIARINAASRNLQRKQEEVAASGERLRQLRYGDLAPRRSRSEELANNRRRYEQEHPVYSSEEERIEDERRGREMRELTERAREMRRQETSNDHIRSHKLDMRRGR